MIIAGRYSFNRGEEYIQANYPTLLHEIEDIISRINVTACKTKESKEKTMTGRMLFDPKMLNLFFKVEFFQREWKKQKVWCEYPTDFYTPDHRSRAIMKGAFREMDFIKDDVGVEVQFGKYSFMVYNVCAKMTIFNKMGFIKAGVEIVPIKQFADEMKCRPESLTLSSFYGI